MGYMDDFLGLFYLFVLYSTALSIAPIM